MRLPACMLLLAVLTLPACASGSGGASGRNADVITREELEPLENFSAYEAVERLRPRWLQARGRSIRGDESLPVVFVDRSNLGGIDALRSVPVQDIETIQFRNARDATTRYGTGYPGGVIEITTRG